MTTTPSPPTSPHSIELPYLREVFDRLRRGAHLSSEDEPYFSALTLRTQDYVDYFAALGLRLIRHEREFFYFEPDSTDKVPDTLPKIAVFSYILIDFAANQGRPVEEFVMGQNFILSRLPHFTLDRYVALLAQVDVENLSDVKTLLGHMERIGWVRWEGDEEFRFLRPFHRVFSKCLELAQTAPTTPAPSAPESSASL